MDFNGNILPMGPIDPTKFSGQTAVAGAPPNAGSPPSPAAPAADPMMEYLKNKVEEIRARAQGPNMGALESFMSGMPEGDQRGL